jgi:uncharacterized protein YqeY
LKITICHWKKKLIKTSVVAMKAKDEVALRGIRAIKSAILLAKTDGSGQAIDEAREVQMLQKLVKSRQESSIFTPKTTARNWRKKNSEEIEVIKRYLPAMLEGAELEGMPLQGNHCRNRRYFAQRHGQSDGRRQQTTGRQSRRSRYFGSLVKKLLGA